MVTILMMSAELVTPDLREIKIFRNKGYEVIFQTMTSQTKFYHLNQIIL